MAVLAGHSTDGLFSGKLGTLQDAVSINLESVHINTRPQGPKALIATCKIRAMSFFVLIAL